MNIVSRNEARAAFLAACGWGEAQVSPLAADASFRSYHRVAGAGRVAVLMDAPPPMEDVRPFRAVDARLRALGLSAPEILAEDVTGGFLLLEDFGDGTFTRLLAAGADEAALYDLAVDALIALHRQAEAAEGFADYALPVYDRARYLAEAGLLADWFLPAAGVALSAADRAAYDAAWGEALGALEGQPETLVLRDFHVDNLMRLSGRAGVAACGLLDFQDAVRGPAVYDLMSLLEDARRDLPPALVARGRARYIEAFPALDRERFAAAWAVLAAQRHAKVIGIFTRLCVRDRKPQYLVHIPRVWRLLEAALAHPALGAAAAWFAARVPADARRSPPCPSV
ncbi:Aminoglycoside phosphotransferase [uncultured Alphaproteobacteria bacterium]|uniref:Aminoglycoside phosphotransferase n=1 Tax=uncultured Alphaproteobacteria bacterium TaxID=91750 RepID=A0A212KKB5_9PROT|nr:Aminoglycoside phosphotransferase [uncultured Alphaproteobacteria bacterium]